MSACRSQVQWYNVNAPHYERHVASVRRPLLRYVVLLHSTHKRGEKGGRNYKCFKCFSWKIYYFFNNYYNFSNAIYYDYMLCFTKRARDFYTVISKLAGLVDADDRYTRAWVRGNPCYVSYQETSSSNSKRIGLCSTDSAG